MAVAASRTARFVRAEPDDVLVLRVRNGDEQAFEAIYERYSRPLLSFCRHMLGDAEEAEDVVQHSFLAAHRALLSDEREIHLKAWLFAIARNRCLSVLRARRDQVGLEDDVPAPSTAGLAAEVERREDLREMLSDLARLPADQRAALLLAELGSHSHDEIAEVLGVRRDKVKALVFQAREGLGAMRDARGTPCGKIREQLATARGAGLRRGPLRRHLELCEGCQEFRDEVARQRAAMGIILPVAPSFALKQAVLTGAAGIGAGAAAAVGGAGLAGTGAVVGAAGVGAAGVGAAGGIKAILGKALVTTAVAAGAGGSAVVGVHEIDSHPRAVARVVREPARAASPTSERTPLPVRRHRRAAVTAKPAPAPVARPHHVRAPHHAKRKKVDHASDTTVLPAAAPPPSAPAPPPAAPAAATAPPQQPAAAGDGTAGKHMRGPKRIPPGQAKKEGLPFLPPGQAKKEDVQLPPGQAKENEAAAPPPPKAVQAGPPPGDGRPASQASHPKPVDGPPAVGDAAASGD